LNGAHDLGGMHGFGPVAPEPDEPIFHAEWERRAFAVTLAAGALSHWNIDMSRFAREQMEPGEYLRTSYYEHWLFGLEKLLVDRGLVTPAELQDGRVHDGIRPEAVPPDRMAAAIRRGGPANVEVDLAPRFRAGDAVVARNIHPVGHTRVPRYVRGRRGVIDRDHGVYQFPDSHALGRGKDPQHCYSVRFTARELWGPDASERDSIYVDLWDDYLDPAP
jgi:nitrile hydratase subunit beta